MKQTTLSFVLFFFACPAWANEVCVDGVCRSVETGPLVKDFQQDVNTAPKPALKHRVTDFKFWLANGASIGSAIAANKTIGDCRRDHGIGVCAGGGYGEFHAREGIRDGTAGVLALVSWKIKSIEDDGDYHHKFWWVFPVGNTAYNLVPIIQNVTRSYGPRQD